MKFSLLLFFFSSIVIFNVRAQDLTVSGKVISSEDGLGLPSVSIMVKGSRTGTSTDADGKYRIKAASNAVLIFKYISFKAQEVSVEGKTILDVTLVSDAQALKEIVVTGYGQQSRKTLTSAITSVSADQIENLPVANTDQLLQGKASGVQVNANNGSPGGGMFVRIRGTSSINGSSDPLYVIDGIPMQSNNLAGIGVGGGVTSPMADLNPADIASMEILKDASATAIYGARAANGVVLITTKRGNSQKAKISLGSYYGAQTIDNKLAVVDGPTFESLMNEAAVNNGQAKPYANPQNAINTNWAEPIFRTAAIRNVDLSVDGGNEKIKYLVSANNFLQEGTIKVEDYARNSLRVNLDFIPVEKLKIGTSTFFTRNKRNRVANDDGLYGPVVGAYNYPSNLPFYNPTTGAYTKSGIYENPLTSINESSIDMSTNRLLTNVYAEYEFIKGLKLKSTFSLDFSNIVENSYFNSLTISGSARNGLITNMNTNDDNWIQENVLTYQFKANKNNFNVLVGTTLQESQYFRSTAIGEQFPSDQFKQITSAAVQRGTTDRTSWGIASLFSRVTYDYDGKYLATVNVRRDGSSRFGEANKWGTFPSVAAGWVMSRESFMQEATAISNLKMRVSYGVTGNQSGISNFQSLGLWGGNLDDLNAPSGNAAYADIPGITPLQLANPDLKWETTRQTDFGIDLGFFKDRLTITADYYVKKTEDLLLSVPLPRTTGYNSVVQNYGEVSNKGFEFSFAASVIQKENFSWNSNFNIAANRSKILKLAAPFNVYNRDLYRYEEGYPLYSFYFHEQTGVDTQTGAPIFTDVNGDGVFDPNVDRKIVGDANPDYFGGFTNTFTYKGFDLMAFLQYSIGNDQLNWKRFFLEHGGTRGVNFSETQLDRWQKPGDVTMIPKMNAENYASNLRSSRFMEDGSYMRLKNVSIGYKLPSATAKKLGMSSVRVYVSGQNLLTFTNYGGVDPELSGLASTKLTQGIEFFSLPQPRVFMAGFNISL